MNIYLGSFNGPVYEGRAIIVAETTEKAKKQMKAELLIRYKRAGPDEKQLMLDSVTIEKMGLRTAAVYLVNDETK